MTYLPTHQPQLGRGTPVPGRTQGSRDCGPRTVQMGVDFQTQGDLVPSITKIRKAMEKPGPQQTSVWDAKLAVESFRSPGRRPLRYYIKDYIADVKRAVRAGKYVHACIDYGTWNDLMNRTGDPHFEGGHSVGILGQRDKGGTVWWLLWDPLDDARRDGIPQGPRWVPRYKLIAAMEDFAGGVDRCIAGVFGGGQER